MQTYRFVREVPVEEGYDVVVAGGGPAGSAAAVSAARLGAKVLLVEATGCLGGMGTSGLVTAFDPMSDGDKMIVGGFMRELVERMYARGFIPDYVTPDYWHKGYHLWTPFNSEGLKLLLDEFVEEAGVEVRLFTRLIDAEAGNQSRQVEGVILNNIEGHRYVRAKTFIDATGDAVLADLCGVPCREAGRDTPNIMPPTLCSLFAGIDWSRIEMGGWSGIGPQKIIPADQQAEVEKAIAEGHFSQRDYHVPGMIRVGTSIGNLNAPHIFNLNALRCRSLTDGMMLGRKLILEYMVFYRKYLPGFENIEHVTTATLMGVRESRRIIGEYELDHDDYLARRQFPDQIGVFNKSVDIHSYDGSKEEHQRHLGDGKTGLGPGECFGLPYGILVPKGWDNLWVAGRCNSSDMKVSATIRVQPAAAMMGQAAGMAAVQSIGTGQPACDMDTAQLVETLRQAGAYLSQEDLSKTMTRSK
jgi:hypothetical protein